MNVTHVHAAAYIDTFRESSSKEVETMLARRLYRQKQRLQTQKNIEKYTPPSHESHVIRLGKKIVPQRYSARRIRNLTDATVVKVFDGSTLVVRLHGYGYLPLKEVRLLGVDAPEVLHDECYALEAKRALEAKILGETVYLEKDDGFLRDSYRRSIHYLRHDNRDVGEWMISRGYAFSDGKVNHSRKSIYDEMQSIAQEDDKGLWSFRCDYDTDIDQTIRVR